MANLIPESSLDDVVALDKGDPIIGARLGMSNRQAQQLLNRQTYIKDSLDSSISDITQELLDNYDMIISRNNALSDEIDNLNNKSDVVDVVATYADLQSYDTSALYNNDIVKVLNDSTKNGRCSYYRWSTLSGTFSFIGVEKASVPIIISSDTADSPIINTTYVVTSGVTLSITDSNAYAGLIISVISKGSCTLNINSNTIYIPQNKMLQYIYTGSNWIVENNSISIDEIYPVGSIYISFNEVSPATFIGGEWRRLDEGYALMTAGRSITPDLPIGSNNVQVTLSGTISATTLWPNHIPNHVHTVSATSGGISTNHTHSIGSIAKEDGLVSPKDDPDGSKKCAYSSLSYPLSSYSDSHYHGVNAVYGSTGSGSIYPHSHAFIGSTVDCSVMQEYIAVSVWCRLR